MTIRNEFTSTLSRREVSLLLVYLALIGFFCPTKLAANDAHFERLGPYGGTVRSLLISPGDNKVVYLGTSDGQIFRSVDGAASWNLLYPGLNRRQLVIDTIVEDPDDAGHLYVGGWDLRSTGGGLFESRDSGRSWSQVMLPVVNVSVRGFAISKGSPSHMVAGTGAGVFMSADGGKSWQETGADMDAFKQAESVAIDPQDPGNLYVGTWHLGYRSRDSGATWVQNDRGMVTDSDVFSIAIDERNPKTMYASACTGLYRSIDQGESWKRLRVLPKSDQVRAQVVYVDPTNSDTVYGGTTEGLFISKDAGKTWNRVTSPELTINAIQVDPIHGTVILIGTDLYGVLRSEDGGRSWTESNTGFVHRSIARIIPDPAVPGRFIVGELSQGKIAGFYEYDNPANDWVQLSPKEIPGEGMLSLLVLPGDQGRLAGTARGVFVQPTGSTAWTALPGPIANFIVYDLAIDPGQEWVFAGTSDGIYRARPEDLNFQKPPNYNSIPHAFSLLVSRRVPGPVFAGTHLGVFRSDDAGSTWQSASEGIPDHTIIECLVFAPGQETHLLAGTSAGLYESKDSGHTWNRTPDGRLGVHISSIVFLDAGGRRILAADNTFGGVFLSQDGGTRWEKIENPQFASPIRSLAQDPLHPSVIYLGTGTEGVYRLSLPTSESGVLQLR